MCRGCIYIAFTANDSTLRVLDVALCLAVCRVVNVEQFEVLHRKFGAALSSNTLRQTSRCARDPRRNAHKRCHAGRCRLSIQRRTSVVRAMARLCPARECSNTANVARPRFHRTHSSNRERCRFANYCRFATRRGFANDNREKPRRRFSSTARDSSCEKIALSLCSKSDRARKQTNSKLRVGHHRACRKRAAD